jgi:hypothetical protein
VGPAGGIACGPTWIFYCAGLLRITRLSRWGRGEGLIGYTLTAGGRKLPHTAEPMRLPTVGQDGRQLDTSSSTGLCLEAANPAIRPAPTAFTKPSPVNGNPARPSQDKSHSQRSAALDINASRAARR